MSNVERFMEAFAGSNVAHGQTKIGTKRRNGKTEAKSFVVREPLTEDKVSDHLSGQNGVGAIPIRDDNKCRFAALDIDTYPIDHQKIVQAIAEFNLPMIVCRSKSGGAHLYMFFDDWYEAVFVREYMTEISAALGYAGCEIFPKQDEILSDRGDVGNFINLPYFDAETTVRYAVDLSGKDMSLEDFLDFVDNNRVSMADLEKIDFGTQREFMDDGPPCLQIIMTSGAMEGSRNKIMFNYGVYLKNKYPEDWMSRFEEGNVRYCKPSLPASEIVTLQQQLAKKDYYYQCKEEPLCSHCNKQLCRSRKHGVGTSEMSMPAISGLTIMLSEPRLYFLDVDGSRLELSTKQLQIPLQFQEACMEQLNYMPPLLKAADWQQIVNDLMSNATTIEVPEELTLGGQFKDLVEQFCTSRIRAMSPEEIELGKPWTDEGKTYFKIKGLQEFLKNRGFTKLNRPQMQQRLEEINNNEPCHGKYHYKDEAGEWQQARVWWVPEFKTQEVELPTGEEYEAPF